MNTSNRCLLLLCAQVFEVSEQNKLSGNPLPREIILDILTRLPAELLYDCGKPVRPLLIDPYFIDMHLQRATPNIAINNYYKTPCSYARSKVSISFTDGKTQKIVTKSIKLYFGSTRPKGIRISPTLYGSYNGILMIRPTFRNTKFCDSVLFMWNPITRYKLLIAAPGPQYHICAFFFHPMSNVYKVLFYYRENLHFNFVLHNLATKSSTQITSYSYPPICYKPPIMSNGALHWIVDTYAYMDLHRIFPRCSKVILVFNMDMEIFSSMSHPGRLCRSAGAHHITQLLELEGKLGCFVIPSLTTMEIWVLEDYEKKIWVKRHLVQMFRLGKHWDTNGQSCWEHFVEAIHIYGDELLIRVYHTKLFLYSLKWGTFRRVSKKFLVTRVIAVPHVSSLLSLNVDGLVTMSP